MLLDGKALAIDIKEELAAQVGALKGRAPCLAVILVGDDPASKIYVASKVHDCEKVGIHSILENLPSSISEKDLLFQIERLNQDPKVDGILVQLPLPDQISQEAVIKAIDPNKDVDGFHPYNFGKIFSGDPSGFVPCTPAGIRELLLRYDIETEGKEVVIVGRSHIVGKPMAGLLMQNGPGGNATVTIVHSKTKDLSLHTKRADILICSIGKPHFIKEEMVKEGAIVVDVGINRVIDETQPKGYRITGDVDFERVKDKCFAITPVPGGVGPMTIAMLLKNTIKSRLSS
ncbi:MAG: bifunctional methylenetetrahydrofolate dehydrogenase/methenyltetrahydrofolate cyclohydrolase FolD [Waddliaceae bacterium]